MREIAYKAGAWAPESRSSYDKPVHSKPIPVGSLAARRSISAMASPELRPGAASPWMLYEGTPL